MKKIKISRREIEDMTKDEMIKIILEQVDNDPNDNKWEKIKKISELGTKIKSLIDNSFSHLSSFINLGTKTQDDFEMRRAVKEIQRIRNLTNDYEKIVIKAHELATEKSEEPDSQPDESKEPIDQDKEEFKLKKMKFKPFDKDKKEPEEDDAEVINKRPDMKHAYEAHPMSTVRPVPSKKTLKDLGAVKVKKKPVKKEDKNDDREFENWKHSREARHDYIHYTDGQKSKNEPVENFEDWADKYWNNKIEESIDFVKDADGKPVRVRDRVIQKAFDPKAKTYKWSMMDKYRVEKILSPDKILVHDFNSEKDFPLNPTQLKRIGIEHLYEYGAVIVNKYDEKNVITEDVKAGSLKEAMILLGMKYPANAFKITNIIENTETCSNCNHQKSDHDEASGYCQHPDCHCTDFEG